MEKNINKSKQFRCGIIYQGVSSSLNGKIFFEEQGITIDGGLLCDERIRFHYAEIQTVYYSTVLPKLRFQLKGHDGLVALGLSLRHTQLRTILKLLREHGTETQKMYYLKNIKGWYRFWYGTCND